ncbi:MAG: methyltransferase domain-containing protein [Proteobacteria bacterium]|nr:methyltransferase domain-containing protein [Pseudomonadota bacterium]
MSRSRHYYDAFSATYEAQRHRGYHRLIDDLETDLALSYCRGGRVLEAGCGTGLILQRLAPAARQAIGIDLSTGMLAGARSRALSVLQGSVDALPFPAAHFDAVVSFKVLAHVPTIERTLAELARVTRPGGHLVLEFYNRFSLRHLVKRLKFPTRIGIAERFTDADVFTRYDTLGDVRRYLPPTLELLRVRGVRVLTPAAQLHDLPGLRAVFGWAERRAADHRLLRHLGGFLIVVLRRRD